MSAITKKEIKQIALDADKAMPWARPREMAIAACERVAALVEERMKEMVCSGCGQQRNQMHIGRNGHPMIGKHSLLCNLADSHSVSTTWITRAQYEAEREEGR